MNENRKDYYHRIQYDVPDFLRVRGVLEQRTLEHLEQNLISRLLINSANDYKTTSPKTENNEPLNKNDIKKLAIKALGEQIGIFVRDERNFNSGKRNENQKPVEERPRIVQLYEFIEDDDYYLDYRIDNSELKDELNDRVNGYSDDIIVPPTPRSTPPPEEPAFKDVETPSISLAPKIEPTIQPELVVPPPPPSPVKNFKTSSTQCDMLPKPETIYVKVPAPVPLIPVNPDPEPVSIKSDSKKTVISSSSTSNKDDSDTSESDTVSPSSSHVITDSNKYEDDETYFSDGAWVLSKSEGQIIQYDNDLYVNLDLKAANTGIILDPKNIREDPNEDKSDGEIRLNKLDYEYMEIYGKQASSGVNKINVAPENGEVVLRAREIGELNQESYISDGEVENPAYFLVKHRNRLLKK